jgi:predicted regulator of Ras-like GTPase activity (Roadblock/LC7/MglB family)
MGIMASIRDVVDALGRREGVEAVILLGNDGLPIASHSANGVDAEVLSALVPNVVQATEQLGHHAGRGAMTTGVIEFASGLAILTNLSSDAKLLVMLRPRTNAGPLLYDLSRHRAEIAGLL